MKRLFLLRAIIPALLLVGASFGQSDSPKKSYTFHGTIESVDQNDKTMKVNGEEVKGWMSAMTMDYKVDDPAVLKKVQPGDHIAATVYDGDLVLHKVQVVRRDSKAK